MTRPPVAKKAIIERDGTKCPICEIRLGREVDHKIPLIDGGPFGLSNLQLLCKPCHKLKTAREATERAQRRKDAERTQEDPNG